MNTAASRKRVLNPLERFCEIVFGIIMVLSFTGALSVAESGREDVHTMLIAAIGCNLAWGIIDAVFYLIGCLVESRRNAVILRSVQQTGDAAMARRMVADALPEPLAAVLDPAELGVVLQRLSKHPFPSARVRLSAENWRGGIAVFLFVFLSTFPVVIPFIFIQDPSVALRISNGIAITMLFGVGYMLAGFAGMRRVATGLVMVAIGSALVALTIALGG